MIFEKIFFGKSQECQFDMSLTSHMVILPGMLGVVSRVFPLVKYLRKNQSRYGITAVPLGLSLHNFESIVQSAEKNIIQNLLLKTDIKEVIIFGHSHGGRIACALFEKLSNRYPKIIFSVITAGTPIEKPKHLVWYRSLFYYLLSSAFRNWPKINQPTNNSVKKYIAYYSNTDEVVDSESAKKNHAGILLELKDFSHRDFIKAEKIGPILLPILNN